MTIRLGGMAGRRWARIIQVGGFTGPLVAGSPGGFLAGHQFGQRGAGVA